MTTVPTFDRLMNPHITALRDLGGSGSVDEIYEKVIENLKFSDDVLSVLHDPEASNQTDVHYRLAWARTYLKTTITANSFLVFACSLLLSAGSARAQTVINGGFELGVSPGFGTTLFAEDSATIDGWIVTSGSVDYTEGRWICADGNRCIDMTGVSAGTLAQTIGGFSVGRTYRLSFYMAANTEGGPATKSMSVSIGSASRIFSFDGTGHSGMKMGWSLRALDFTATNSTLTLAFTGLQSGIYGAALDSVSIGDVPLELSIRCSQVEVCWPSLTNFTYQIQYRSILTTSMWVNLGPPMTGNGSNNCILDTVAPEAPQRFYQVIRLEQ